MPPPRLPDQRSGGYRWLEPPRWGARVTMRDGGPEMLIVDLRGNYRTCAWPGHELELHYDMLSPTK